MSKNPQPDSKSTKYTAPTSRKSKNRGELKKRRVQVLALLAEGKNFQQIAEKTGVSSMQVSRDVKAIKKSANDFLQNAVLENTAYILSLSLHNVHKVIEKANQIFESTHDERMKVWVCKLVLEATKLQNDTVLQGYNHVSVTESNKLLEYADKMSGLTEKDKENGKLRLKSYMPPSLKTVENVNQNVPILEKVEPEVEPTVEPGVNPGSEITSDVLNKHVSTNYFYIKKKSEPDQKVNKE